jgi:hypothetical protein
MGSGGRWARGWGGCWFGSEGNVDVERPLHLPNLAESLFEDEAAPLSEEPDLISFDTIALPSEQNLNPFCFSRSQCDGPAREASMTEAQRDAVEDETGKSSPTKARSRLLFVRGTALETEARRKNNALACLLCFACSLACSDPRAVAPQLQKCPAGPISSGAVSDGVTPDLSRG